MMNVKEAGKLFLYLLAVCCAFLIGGVALTTGEAYSNKQVCDIVCTPYQGEWNTSRETCACKNGIVKKNVCEWKVVEASE